VRAVLEPGQVLAPVLVLLQLVAVQAPAQVLVPEPVQVLALVLAPEQELVLVPELVLVQVLALAPGPVLVLGPALVLVLAPVPVSAGLGQLVEPGSQPKQLPSAPPPEIMIIFWLIY
jgi:hypothetical protein